MKSSKIKTYLALGLFFLLDFNRIVQGLSNMECYRCTESPVGNSGIQCNVQEDANLLELQENYEYFGDMWDSDEISTMSNPCLMVTQKVLDFVKAEDGLFYKETADVDEIDEEKHQEIARSAISSIQFQKRPNSNWLVAEVQLRDTLDVFSFILTDPALELLNIPYDSRYYISL